MGAKERIGMLESLLGRIKARAAEPRPVAAVAAPTPDVAPVSIAPVAMIDAPPTAPPPAEAAVALRAATPVPAHTPTPVPQAHTPTPVPEAPPPMESRARLVAAEERGAPDEVLELDDRHVVQDDGEVSVSVVEADAAEAELLSAAEAEAEAAPPSSKRPIAEPLAEPMPVEAPKHTPPPESGKQVAALSFDDDFTGVREANKSAPQAMEADIPGGETIPLASQRPPQVAAKDEMEADLPTGGQAAPGQFTADLAPPPSSKPPSKPPSVRLPSERPAPALAMEPEVVKPVLAISAKPATFEGSITTFKPTTFAELLEASLGL